MLFRTIDPLLTPSKNNQMKTSRFVLSSIILLISAGFLAADGHKVSLNPDKVKAHNATVSSVEYKGKSALRAEISAEAREKIAEARRKIQESGARGPAAFEAARHDHLVVVGENFQNGTIELEMAGEPAPGASGGARGFVGIAFRVQPDMKHYDCFYIRPTNGRANDQERRNHSAQYISHPEFPWYKLRSETPSKYESYVDLQPATWTKVKVVVEGETAKLFVHGNDQPTIIVNDVKSGADAKGAVALWFEGSTVAHYRNVSISH